MKKTLSFMAIALSCAILSGCSNNDEPLSAASYDSSIEVVKLKEFNSKTRSESVIEDENVLKFKNQEQYEYVLGKLRNMDDTQKCEYFKNLGFTGAYMVMRSAETELEKIFDAANSGLMDSIQMDSAIKAYRAKYNGVLSFSNEDSNDDTPYFGFTDENSELLGSVNGYMIIGDEIVAPQNTLSSALYAGEFKTYEKSEVKLSGEGGYNSYFHLGKIGQYLAFKVVTYKQKFAHKSFDKSCIHTGHLKVVGSKSTIDSGFTTIGAYCTTKVLLSDMSPYMNLTLTDFSCSRYPDKKVSKTINNILVN